MHGQLKHMLIGIGKDFLAGLVALGVAIMSLFTGGTQRLHRWISAQKRKRLQAKAAKQAAMLSDMIEDEPLPSFEDEDAFLDDRPFEDNATTASLFPEMEEQFPEKPKRRRRILKRWHLLASSISVGFIALIVVIGGNWIFAASILPEDDVDLWTVNRPTSLTFLDRHGDVIGQRGIRYADPVPLEDLPPYLIDAFLATEDRRFYGHRGYDARGLLRASFANMRAGSVVEGGSTITQQLAKNLFLGPERTLERKFEELQYALWLEAHLTKDEILSLYLNRIYLGGGTYGVEAASQAYFSKSARDLTVAEAALLAGLPKAPSTLSPTINPDGAQARAREVIDNLVETKRLDEVEAEVAKTVGVQFDFPERIEAHGYFLDYTAQRIQERLGDVRKDLVVSTTFDPALQAHAEKAVREGINEESQAQGAEQAALIAFDRDGGIVAMVGGLDYEDSQFNRATQAKRQPGSAFKVFVYLAALEAGLSPDSVLIDHPIKVGDWAPTNYNNRHAGPMRLSAAAALSTNSIAVQITEAIGRDRVIDAARRAGVSTDLPSVRSLSLGAVAMTLDELTAAYMTFAHQGAEMPAHAVTEIRTRDGEVLYTYQTIDGYSVIDPAKASDTTRLLMTVMERGTGSKGRFGSHQLAGKTGTTNDWRDAWFIGFSHHYTAGVWVGNDENRGMDRVSGSSVPLTIWKDFMQQAHDGLPAIKLLEEGVPERTNIRDVAGLYASLRTELYNTAYPLPDVDWEEIESPRENSTRRRGIFGWGRRDEPEPEPQVEARPAVVGSAAPGIREKDQ